MIIAITFFIFALIIGVAVIGRVPATLHTPLMSGANSIHGVVLVGVIVVAAESNSMLGNVIIFFAALLGTLNVVGGYVVTDRMLEMFKPKEKKSEFEAQLDSDFGDDLGANGGLDVLINEVQTGITAPQAEALDEEYLQMQAVIQAKQATSSEPTAQTDAPPAPDAAVNAQTPAAANIAPAQQPAPKTQPAPDAALAKRKPGRPKKATSEGTYKSKSAAKSDAKTGAKPAAKKATAKKVQKDGDK